MELIAVIAIVFLGWIFWSLFKAKRFNQFKFMLMHEIKPKVIKALEKELTENRSAQTPNNKVHIEASIYYWTQYPVRILQAALNYKIIDEQWLKKTGNWRNSQHLFFIEAKYKQTVNNTCRNEASQNDTFQEDDNT